MIGVVVIGRNEGPRLPRCLRSVAAAGRAVVYVDSGSTDGSVEAAKAMGACVVELDASRPFSAARARNEGFQRLMDLCPGLAYVQFVDGDCELMAGWIERGVAELERRAEVAVVCGRLRERHPEASVYNRLCDLEWNTQVGEVDECGGIAMYRAGCFREAGGFNPSVVAGEEPELCLRLRRGGWKIVRLPDEMAWHDAAMSRFGQWWKRSVRSGQACAQAARLHGRAPDEGSFRRVRRLWFWAALLPLAALGGAYWTGGLSLGLLGAYALLGMRIARQGRRDGWTPAQARLYAVFTILGKWPELIGVVRYYWTWWRGMQPKLIEHKESSQQGLPGMSG